MNKLHLVNWSVVVWRNKKGVWILEVFLFLIRPCWGNGLGDLWRKGILFENRLLLVSMGCRRGRGAQRR